MDHLAQATTDHNMQYVIKSTRRADSTHSNLTATAKLPPLNGHRSGHRRAGLRPRRHAVITHQPARQASTARP